MKHVIYVPGLGDHFDQLRRLALSQWRSSETRVTFVPMHWNDKHETYEDKCTRVLEAVEQAKGDDILLVGESAGGAMALLAFSQTLDKVGGILTICGYNHGAAAVHPYHKHKHPAFYQLMPVVDSIVQQLTSESRSRITTLYSTRDHVVAPEHSRLEGAKEMVVHTRGHFGSIARVLISPPEGKGL